MQSVVPGPGNLLGEDRRERVVHGEAQAENGPSDERYLLLPDRLGGAA